MNSHVDHTFWLVLLTAAGAFLTLLSASASAQDNTISLAGQWRFLMNGPKPGAKQEALPNLRFTDTIDLPGTTETRHKGSEQGAGWNGQLTRLYRFDGPAWYQRELTIPDAWRGKRVTLSLERTKYTQVWLDGRPLGESPILCTPQEYVLGGIAPGSHQLTILVDNTRRPVPGDMHQMSDNTQGNWNGILGKIELRATDPVWLDDVQVYPDAARRAVTVKTRLGNSSGSPGTGTLIVQAQGEGIGSAAEEVAVTWTADGGTAEIELSLGALAALWDEFTPTLHTLTVRLQGNGISDQRTIHFGLRDFTTSGSQFAVNGRTTFLRGKHDACVFPLTGHPPMDVEGWLRYFRICQDYGINHVRFHTWTPPEAAFTAADQLGIYLQPELPFWGDFTEDVKRALKPEAERILKHLGNHPSFVMFTMGNENRHSRQIMGSLVSELRELDGGRRLYAQGSNNFMWDPQLPDGDDFLISARVKNSPDSSSRNIRGSHATADNANGHLQIGPPDTMADYADAIAGIPRPVVSHEIGQWTVYPNFREISKYTGVMRPHNLEHFRKRLDEAGMLDQADDFFRASGKLAAICYREEIEAALRTRGFGGFQLLDLQDFPGQGTALVGVLDAFMDPKGCITPEQWRQFCSPVVLLARFGKYTWTADETFTADIQVAHYGQEDLSHATLAWTIRDGHGKTVATGKLAPTSIQQGGVRPLGTLSASLAGATTPAKFTLELELDGLPIRTSYPLWIYPPRPSTQPASDAVTVTQVLNAKTRQTLLDGGRVLLIADGKRPLARTVGGGFTTEFWCWPMFHNKPGTMGLLCDSKHPALRGFPTDSHSDWQWFDLAVQSQPLILDTLPRDCRPIVQTIDNMERVHRLGLIFELKVGPGRLLVCATDLLAMHDRPEARQLLASLLEYAASDDFGPRTEASIEQLRDLLQTTIPMDGAKATASSQAAGWQKRGPEQAIDGNEHTLWRAADDWWQVTFTQPQDLSGGEILWGDDRPGYSYLVEGSTDGSTNWQTLDDQQSNTFTAGRHRLQFAAKGIRAIRVTITGAPAGRRVSIREARFFGTE